MDANHPIGYAARLESALAQAGLSVRDLADHLGITSQAVYKVLRGQTKSLQVGHHLRAARFLGVDPTWLSDGVGTRHPKGPVALRDNPDYPTLPLVKITFREDEQGHQIEIIDGPAARIIVLPESWYRSNDYDPARLIATAVHGPAMEPTLHDGDVVVWNLADRAPVTGEVYLLRLDNQPVPARLFKEGSTWFAHFDNPDQRRHPRRELPVDVAIVGRAVHRQSDRI
jgi:phage repressor protein C with HTH and peptisase S24 domain